MDKIFIKKILIEGLWDRYKIEWKLDESVNILIGKNGTGKTTILNIIDEIITDKPLFKNYIFNNIEVELSNNSRMLFSHKQNDIGDEYNRDEMLKLIDSLRADMLRQISSKDTKKEDKSKIPQIMNFPEIAKISTFDMNLLNKKASKNYNDREFILTELDSILYDRINDFKSYQLTLKNKIIETDEKIENKIKSLTDKTEDLLILKELLQEKEEEINLILENKNRFIDIINKLFSVTNKTFDLDKNNSIVFNINEKIIPPHQLSSGEKQMLIILLTVLLKENKPFILLMDEPEISLHVEWQSSLIDNLIKLNPNMQIILATHSSAMVIDGWMDKVIRISDISFEE